MISPDPQMAFAAKEEILRNIVKTHSIILVEGWTGTGKTFTTLKAVRGLGDIYYYTEPAGDMLRSAKTEHDKLTVVAKAVELRGVKPGKQCIIFDDLARLGEEARGILKDMITNRVGGRKILVITQVVLDAQEFLENIDAVVRFKQDTAEILHSKLNGFDG